jgi:hypothetical protein
VIVGLTVVIMGIVVMMVTIGMNFGVSWNVHTLRRIWGSHSSGNEELCHLGCNRVLLVQNWQKFLGTCRLHLRGWRISQARNQHETGSGCLLPASVLVSQKIRTLLTYTWMQIQSARAQNHA